ncbi:MAG: FtsQ-type POTRA domain-containing protein [Desulfobacteraceae bacterium]|nr:FtsQ-type POTRA domain-containing protein [Desulfobacteraceae bacterium]
MRKNKKTRRNKYKTNKWKPFVMLCSHSIPGAKLCGVFFVMLALSVLFIAGYAVVSNSNYFQAETVKVSGNLKLPVKMVLTQAGLKLGDNILAVNLSMARKRLIAHPWIASARVSRQMPGAIHIHIEEQNAIAVVDLGRKFLLNEKGRIFKEQTKDDPKDFPQVSGMIYADINLGEDNLSPALSKVLEVLAISRKETKILPYKTIENIHYDPDLGLTVTERVSGRQIRIGAQNLEAKFKSLSRLKPQLASNPQWQKYRAIDLNDPDRIVVQF